MEISPARVIPQLSAILAAPIENSRYSGCTCKSKNSVACKSEKSEARYSAKYSKHGRFQKKSEKSIQNAFNGQLKTELLAIPFK